MRAHAAHLLCTRPGQDSLLLHNHLPFTFGGVESRGRSPGTACLSVRFRPVFSDGCLYFAASFWNKDLYCLKILYIASRAEIKSSYLKFSTWRDSVTSPVTSEHINRNPPAMEVVQKEHSRLLKRTEGSQGIKNVQSAIDSLQSARDAIAAGQ